MEEAFIYAAKRCMQILYHFIAHECNKQKLFLVVSRKSELRYVTGESLRESTSHGFQSALRDGLRF